MKHQMIKSRTTQIGRAAVFAGIALTVVACGRVEKSQVTLEIRTSGETNALASWLVPSAVAAPSEIGLCFRRLRIRKLEVPNVEDVRRSDVGADDSDATHRGNDDTASEIEPDQIDFRLGQVVLNSTSQTLGKIEVPAGMYDRVTFDLEPACAGRSVWVGSGAAQISLRDKVRARFFGRFDASQSEQKVVLYMDRLADRLEVVTQEHELAAVFEAFRGRM